MARLSVKSVKHDCIKAGVLPRCYENTTIEVELQEQSVISCFTLNANGTVTCLWDKYSQRQKCVERTQFMVIKMHTDSAQTGVQLERTQKQYALALILN